MSSSADGQLQRVVIADEVVVLRNLVVQRARRGVVILGEPIESLRALGERRRRAARDRQTGPADSKPGRSRCRYEIGSARCPVARLARTALWSLPCCRTPCNRALARASADDPPRRAP